MNRRRALNPWIVKLTLLTTATVEAYDSLPLLGACHGLVAIEVVSRGRWHVAFRVTPRRWSLRMCARRADGLWGWLPLVSSALWPTRTTATACLRVCGSLRKSPTSTLVRHTCLTFREIGLCTASDAILSPSSLGRHLGQSRETFSNPWSHEAPARDLRR